jgi:hypothetical protein
MQVMHDTSHDTFTVGGPIPIEIIIPSNTKQGNKVLLNRSVPNYLAKIIIPSNTKQGLKVLVNRFVPNYLAKL